MQAVIDRPPPPAPARDDRGGNGGRWVHLFRARGDIEAHLLSGRLGSAGIETSFLRSGGSLAWLHNGADPRAPVDVLVKKHQLEEARLVMAEIAFEQPTLERTELGSQWRTALVWWSAALALGLGLTGIALARTSQQINCAESACPDGTHRP